MFNDDFPLELDHPAPLLQKSGHDLAIATLTLFVTDLQLKISVMNFQSCKNRDKCLSGLLFQSPEEVM